MGYRVSGYNLKDQNGTPSNKIYKSSGLLTENSLIMTGVGVAGGIIVYTDGSNDAICTIYDNTAASGKVAGKALAAGADDWGGKVIPFRVDNGIYATISGTGAAYIVYYL